MEKQRNLSQPILIVALATALLLLVPFVAMQFHTGVNWSAGDFIVAGALIFVTGLSLMLVMRYATTIVYRAAIILALGSTFFMIWANLAVGLIGGGPNPGNLMYLGVMAIGIIGTILSRFTPGGMERVMYAMTLALVLLAAIALSTNMHEYPGSSVVEIIGVNAFFATLFAVSGLLFRYAALNQSSQPEKSAG